MATAATVRDAALFAVLADLSKNRGSRQLLPDDSLPPVTVNIDARIKRAKVIKTLSHKTWLIVCQFICERF